MSRSSRVIRVEMISKGVNPDSVFVGLSSRSETIRLLASIESEVGPRPPVVILFCPLAVLEADTSQGKGGVATLHRFGARMERLLSFPDNLSRRS